MGKRCAWTGSTGGDLKELRLVVPNRWGGELEEQTFWVAPQYEQELRRFVQRVTRFGKLFVVGMTCLSAVAAASALVGALFWSGAYWAAAATVVLTGLFIVVFPFATPETVSLLGMRAARALGRVGGVIVMMTGIGVFILLGSK